MLNQRAEGRMVQREPFGKLAFCLAVLLIVLPAQSDTLHSLYNQQRFTEAKIVWGTVFLLVFTPLVVSLLRQRRYPGRWEGRVSTVFTACVLVYDIVSAIAFFGSRVGA